MTDEQLADLLLADVPPPDPSRAQVLYWRAEADRRRALRLRSARLLSWAESGALLALGAGGAIIAPAYLLLWTLVVGASLLYAVGTRDA